MKPAYLVYNLKSGEWVIVDRLVETTPHLRRWPGASMMLLHETWLRFGECVGTDVNQTFDLTHIAAMTGIARSYAVQWLSWGIISPTIQGGRGQGQKSLWSYRDAFLCAVVGCLRRAGAKKEHLTDFFHAVRDGEKRSTKPEPTAREAAVLN